MGERATTRPSTNGATSRSFAVASAVAYDDPMAKVFGLDAKTSTWGAMFGFTSGGTALAAAALALASLVAWMHATAPEVADKPGEVEIMREEAPPPPPTATVTPEAKAPPPHVRHRKRHRPPLPPRRLRRC
jgi:hypothetical protein